MTLLSLSAKAPSGYFQTPFGTIALYDDGEFVTGLAFGPLHCQSPRPTRLTNEMVRQLRLYFSQRPFTFNLPLKLGGTPFQQRVWQAMQQIPYGQVVRYGELAAQLGSSARAVGGACGANPVPVIVPCHRVVAAHDLGGFSGSCGSESLGIKQWLLEHEHAQW